MGIEAGNPACQTRFNMADLVQFGCICGLILFNDDVLLLTTCAGALCRGWMVNFRLHHLCEGPITSRQQSAITCSLSHKPLSPTLRTIAHTRSRPGARRSTLPASGEGQHASPCWRRLGRQLELRYLSSERRNTYHVELSVQFGDWSQGICTAHQNSTAVLRLQLVVSPAEHASA